MTTKPAGPVGRGLGLALVRRAAAALGGTVEARNDGGAVFTVRLPHAPAGPGADGGRRGRAGRRRTRAATRAAARRHPRGRGLAMTVRTLIVDDDVRVADIHKGYVERVEGFAVAGVANRGTEALRRVLEDEPDLVLLDIYLPDLGGLEVCRRLRAANNLVDVIAVTAARDVDTVKGAVGLGVAQYLVKPFTFATFRDKLERYAAYRALAERGGEAEQQEIDAMLGELRTPGATPLPKGLSRGDARARGQDAQGAPTTPSAPSRSPSRPGLSRVTARRYLEHLVSADQAELELRYGGSGRPEHRYRWACR